MRGSTTRRDSMSITRAWVARWTASPDVPVLWTPATRWLDGDDMGHRSRRAAAQLAKLGIGAGDRVLLSGAASADLVVCYVALLRLGAVVVPAGSHATLRELDHIVADAAPVLAVIDDPARVPGLRTVSPDLPIGDTRLPEVELDLADEKDAAWIGYTSGTTGSPKGAVLTHRNVSAGLDALVAAWAWRPEDRLVLALPLHHMHGLGVGLTGTLHAGASIVLLPRFDAHATVAAIAEQEATLFFGVPTMYARLASAGLLGGLRSLRLAVSGSAPLSPALWQRVADESGQQLLERYGMTETLMLASNPLDGERRPGTVGPPLPDVEIRLDPHGSEVEVRGPNVFGGYWQRPELAKEIFTDDGFFRTGDVGRWDSDGYLVLVGRRSELIITGGYNVYPREVEDVLREHPQVADAALVGVGDPEWGEVVVAFVVPMPSASGEDGVASIDLAAVAAFVAERVSPYKRPRRWFVAPDLPRNPMGKVLRAELRRMAAQQPPLSGEWT